MTTLDPKRDFHRYLQDAREAVLWKLDGLPEYDVRRPLLPTGTNLLGQVKHLARVEIGYFGDTFGRPLDDPALKFDPTVINIVRELIDGATGLNEGNSNMLVEDPAWWASYRSGLENVAREAGRRWPGSG